MSERQAAAAQLAAAAPPAAAPAARMLQIVVGDRATVARAPIEVLPASAPKPPPLAPLARRAEPPPAPEPVAPAPWLGRLMRIHDVSPSVEPEAAPAASKPLIPPSLARLVAAAFTAHRSAAAEPDRVQMAAAAPAPMPAAKLGRKAGLARAAAARKAELVRAEARKAELAQAAAHRIELAKAAKAAKQQQMQLAAEARVEKREQLRVAAARTAKQEQLRLAAEARAEKQQQQRLAAAKAEKQQLLRLARAEAKGRAEAMAEAKAQARAEARAEALAEAREDARKRRSLASLVRAVQHALPHQAAQRSAPPVEVARADRKHARKVRHQAQVERASLKTRRPPRLAEPPAPPSRPSGLMKASTPRCANRDPGEALVCADASLGAADRQLARAYQGARAAGVSEDQLQRQQQHWLAARSAAAREAPWAVRDVYLARIAELNGQAKEAHGDGY